MCDETAVVWNDVIDVTGLPLSDLASSDHSRLADALRRILSQAGDRDEATSGFSNTI